MQRLLLAALMLCMGLLPLSAKAQLAVGMRERGEHEFEHKIRACGWYVCKVVYSPGGFVHDYERAAKLVKRRKIFIIIAGPCLSACAIFADLIRPRVCITDHALFGFHRVRFSLASRRTHRIVYVEIPKAGDPRGEQRQSKAVLAWVRQHGGFPVNGMTKMHAQVARRFWPHC